MLLSSAPSKLVLPFASGGGKTNPIPVPSQIGITGGAASYTDGFPPLTRTPVASGGIPPFGVDMNGVLYAISAIARWQNAGASFPYDNAFATDTNVGGYPKGAEVLRSDGMGFWLNQADNNITDPESSPTGWVPGFTNGAAPVSMSSSNVTLTPIQYGQPIIVISGVLTANVQLIFPAIQNVWTIINNTTGAFTVTAKTAGGTGTAVSGKSFIVCDGTNIYSIAGAVGALLAANNLSDVASAPTSLANIGGAAKSANLSDLASVVTALSNLGGMAKAQNLSDVASLVTALANLGFAGTFNATGQSSFSIPFGANKLIIKVITNLSAASNWQTGATWTYTTPFPNATLFATFMPQAAPGTPSDWNTPTVSASAVVFKTGNVADTFLAYALAIGF